MGLQKYAVWGWGLPRCVFLCVFLALNRRVIKESIDDSYDTLVVILYYTVAHPADVIDSCQTSLPELDHNTIALSQEAGCV